MMKYISTAAIILFGLMTLQETANAAESEVPEPFQGFDEQSKYSITYEDLSNLLLSVVVDVATSKREVAQPAKQITGTRMKVKVNKLTVNEGNRFFYEAFEDNEAGRQYLLEIQKNLEALPSEAPLEKFSRDEQLA